MGDFTLDTSGAVVPLHAGKEPAPHLATIWPDLSPFEQGYVEAMLRAAAAQGLRRPVRAGSAPTSSVIAWMPLGFSDLAPETLDAVRRSRFAFERVPPITLALNNADKLVLA